MPHPKLCRKRIAACRVDFDGLLSIVIQPRYPAAEVAGVAQHVGASLYLFLQQGSCTRQDVRAVLNLMREALERPAGKKEEEEDPDASP